MIDEEAPFHSESPLISVLLLLEVDGSSCNHRESHGKVMVDSNTDNWQDYNEIPFLACLCSLRCGAAGMHPSCQQIRTSWTG